MARKRASSLSVYVNGVKGLFFLPLRNVRNADGEEKIGGEREQAGFSLSTPVSGVRVSFTLRPCTSFFEDLLLDLRTSFPTDSETRSLSVRIPHYCSEKGGKEGLWEEEEETSHTIIVLTFPPSLSRVNTCCTKIRNFFLSLRPNGQLASDCQKCVGGGVSTQKVGLGSVGGDTGRKCRQTKRSLYIPLTCLTITRDR